MRHLFQNGFRAIQIPVVYLEFRILHFSRRPCRGQVCGRLKFLIRLLYLITRQMQISKRRVQGAQLWIQFSCAFQGRLGRLGVTFPEVKRC